MEKTPKQISSLAIAIALAVFLAVPARAIQWTHYETAVRGYPVMRDASGARIADGTFVQWIEKDGLHVQITYVGESGRRMEETIVMQQRPELAQTRWQWRELQGNKPLRTFEVNLGTGLATASKEENGEIKHWSDTLKVSKG